MSPMTLVIAAQPLEARILSAIRSIETVSTYDIDALDALRREAVSLATIDQPLTVREAVLRDALEIHIVGPKAACQNARILHQIGCTFYGGLQKDRENANAVLADRGLSPQDIKDLHEPIRGLFHAGWVAGNQLAGKMKTPISLEMAPIAAPYVAALA
jgi:hypothetical protein